LLVNKEKSDYLSEQLSWILGNSENVKKTVFIIFKLNLS